MARSRTQNVLIGCGIGCGLLVLLSIGGCVGFLVWLQTPGQLLEPEALLGPDTTGYAEWTLRLEDPGTRNLVERTLELAQNLNRRSGIPGPIGDWLHQVQGRRNQEELEAVFPMVVAWSSMKGSTPEDDLHLITVSVRALGNKMVLADWALGTFLLRAKGVKTVRYEGEKIYQLGNEITFFIRRADFFLVSDLDMGKRVVDRLNRATSEASEVGNLFDDLDSEIPLRGAMTNGGGELFRVVRDLLDIGDDEEIWEAMESATLSGGFNADAAFEASLSFSGADPEWAERIAPRVTEALRSSLEQIDLPIEIEERTEENRVRIELLIQDLPGLLEKLYDDSRRIRTEG